MKTAGKRITTFFRKKSDYIISYFLVVGPRILYILLFVYPMYVTGDELFLFYFPAKLAGLDWSSSMTEYRYYGYGFSILLTPLFKIVDSPVLLYRLCLIIVSFIEGLIPIIICFLLKTIFEVTNRKIIFSIVLVCSYAVNVTVGYMYNEHIYTVCVWGCFLWTALLIKHNKNRKKKNAYSILLGLNMILALTVHQRAITLLIGFILVYIGIMFLYKKKVGNIWLIIFVYTLGTLVDNWIMTWIISFLKGTEQIGGIDTIQNTGVDFTIPRMFFTDLEYMRAIARIVIGQINIWNFATGGFAIFTIVLVIYLLCKKIRGNSGKKDVWIIVLGGFSLACIAITIMGHSISWGAGVKGAWAGGNNKDGSLRALIYLRYLYAYYPPILMAVLAYVYKYPIVYYRLFRYSLLCTITMMLIWLKDIVPFIQNVRNLVPKALSFTRFSDMEVSAVQYFTVVFIVLFFIFVFTSLFRKGKIELAMIICSVFFVYYYTFQMVEAESATTNLNYGYSDGSYKVIQQLQKDKIECDIYVRAGGIPRSGQGILYQMQFMNMRTEIYKGLPSEDSTEVFYFTLEPEKDNQLLERGYVLYQIDDNEYAYVAGENVKEYMANIMRDMNEK